MGEDRPPGGFIPELRRFSTKFDRPPAAISKAEAA